VYDANKKQFGNNKYKQKACRKKIQKTKTKNDDDNSDGEQTKRQQTQRRSDCGRVCGAADRGCRRKTELPIGVTHGNRRRRNIQCDRRPGVKLTAKLSCNGHGVDFFME